MKFVILTTNRLKEKRIFETKKIYRSALKRGIETYFVHPNDLVYFISNNEIKIFYKKVDLTDTDVVLVRRVTEAENKAYEMLSAFKKLHTLIVSDNQMNPFPSQKIIQQLKKINLFPKSIYFTKEQKECVLKVIIKQIGFPFVLKPNNGVGGQFVCKIENEKDFLKYFKNNEYSEFIAQEVLDAEAEYRVFVINGESLGACEKISDNFTKNACKGSKFIYRRVKDIEKVAIRYAKVFGAEIAGVDVVRTKKNEIKLLEINYCPGFIAFTKASKIKIEDKIIDYCLEKYKKDKKVIV